MQSSGLGRLPRPAEGNSLKKFYAGGVDGTEIDFPDMRWGMSLTPGATRSWGGSGGGLGVQYVQNYFRYMVTR